MDAIAIKLKNYLEKRGCAVIKEGKEKKNTDKLLHLDNVWASIVSLHNFLNIGKYMIQNQFINPSTKFSSGNGASKTNIKTLDIVQTSHKVWTSLCELFEMQPIGSIVT